MGNNVPHFETLERVTLLGGGVLGPGDLTAALTLAPRLVAADGGAAIALAAGHMPEAVYGDMDSLPAAVRACIPADRVHQLSEQDSTDFDKALRHIRAPVVLAAGFTGDRVDHELAVYHVLAARSGIRCVVLGVTDIIFHAPPRIRLDLPVDTRVSLFPLADVTGQGGGLAWPIDGLGFHPSRRIGTSNRAVGGPVELAFDAPGMLVILPRDHLAHTLESLEAASVWSRAPGRSWL